jgi:uncharacterized coiled-coil protein SlyX
VTEVTDYAAVAVRLVLGAADGVPVPAGWLQTATTVALALGAAYFAYRQATRVARISAASAAAAAQATAATEAKRIESGAYERAKGLMEAGVAQQAAQMERVERALAAEQQQTERLRGRVVELEDEVARLRRRLIVAGLDETPPPAVG